MRLPGIFWECSQHGKSRGCALLATAWIRAYLTVRTRFSVLPACGGDRRSGGFHRAPSLDGLATSSVAGRVSASSSSDEAVFSDDASRAAPSERHVWIEVARDLPLGRDLIAPGALDVGPVGEPELVANEFDALEHRERLPGRPVRRQAEFSRRAGRAFAPLPRHRGGALSGRHHERGLRAATAFVRAAALRAASLCVARSSASF